MKTKTPEYIVQIGTRGTLLAADKAEAELIAEALQALGLGRIYTKSKKE